MEFLTKLALAFEHGGFWMWPILLIQVSSIAIMIERAYALFVRRKISQTQFALGFEESIRRGEMDQVITKAQAASAQNPVARAIAAGAFAAKNLGGKEEIQGKMDEVLLEENAHLDHRTGFLTMLGNVATLTGLLGTISGMIKSFAAVAFANPADKASLLSAGISEAMNATAYGLIAAIPALVAYAILQNRANRLAEDLNQGGLKVYNWLSYAYEPLTAYQIKTANAKSERNNEINA
ncbi:gliding motility protein [Bdellovibrio bacteriovorus]|uniref:Gliding motility protein n=1 Tax=Bdellovibrio bacteriovorus TaxID=959 RepID=A0A150WF46_BDEBC|nr:MotA/TolQ/ExbB proton channel family protein [Bdellovibrio bacteriovorus]KYG61602.1 gliding motility protein [Bdellovibrio bacteriovorus]